MNTSIRPLLAAAIASMATASGAAESPLQAGGDACFFVGGSYVADGSRQFMSGQMYVRHLKPANKTRPFPIVMVHGKNNLDVADVLADWIHRKVE
jgi:hypothetical protein